MTTRTATPVRQYLAATFFIVIGLTAYGCGDSATVNPVVELASLTVSPGSLEPGFSGGTTQYRVDLTSDTTTVTITAQPAVASDSVTINGQATTSRTITLEPAGETTIVNIVVSETDTNSRTYVIRLVRAGLAGNNSLQNLTMSPGTLAPTFDPNLQAYTVSVANNVGSVTVTPTLSDPAATMTVNGQAALSGQGRVITLNGGGQNTVITIAVTAQNGNLKNYQVTVSRGRSNNNNLRSLGISPGTLSPAFGAGTTGYTVNLPATLASNVTSIRVTPTLQDTTATMTVNGQATTSGTARTAPLPAPGSNNFINIVVVAQDGTSKTYSVNVIRAALGGNNNLRSLTVSQGTLAPAFSANTTAYTVDVGSGVTSISVTPTLSDSAATMTVNGQAATSGQARAITLRAAGLSTTINTVVTAPNGSQKTYTITVDRATPPPPSGNNNLSALSVRVGNTAQALSPPFASGTQNYTVNVATDVTEVTVIATKSDPNAVISGDVPNSGQANITLTGAGTTTRVSITVTAPNGIAKAYTIDVIRAAPAAPLRPASAPDLIDQDDTCTLDIPNNPTQCTSNTSNADNITTVTTPRFAIAPPQAGQTPNLYINGAKVESLFNQSDNTLRPIAALSDGTHTITYTVTNAAGLESPQSPSLSVTINTGAPGPPAGPQ